MTFLYPFLSVAAALMTIIAMMFAWLIALFVDSYGNLPSWLSWFQPSDNYATGDSSWKAEHPNASNYWLAITYMMRNPAQGFDQFCKARVNNSSTIKVRGNPSIRDGNGGVAGYYFITCKGYFHLAWIVPIGFGKCITSGFGWRLHPLAAGYEHATLGQLVFTPFRFYKFIK